MQTQVREYNCEEYKPHIAFRKIYCQALGAANLLLTPNGLCPMVRYLRVAHMN
jgi:hypothetical protein